MYESNEYRASKKWPYAISAGCVVYRENNGKIEILLLKRKPSHSFNVTDVDTYNLPKGHVARDETLEQTAKRETSEEAGCEVEIKTYLGTKVWDLIHPVHKIHVQKTAHFFAAQWLKDLDSMDVEHDEKIWVSVGEALKLLGAPNPKGEDEMVKRLLDFLRPSHE